MRYERELICASDEMIIKELYRILHLYRGVVSCILEEPSLLDEYSLFIMGMINLHTLNQTSFNNDYIEKMKRDGREPVNLFEQGIRILRAAGNVYSGNSPILQVYQFLKKEGKFLKTQDYEFIETAGLYWYKGK
jgi:hypothetical protein